MVDKKTTRECGIFQLFDSMIINDAGCIEKLKSGFPWQQLHSTRQIFPPAIWTQI
jgi:hypothetical protein